MAFQKFLLKEKEHVDLYIHEFYRKLIDNEEEPYLRDFHNYELDFVLQGGRRLHPIALIETYKGLASDRDLLEIEEEIYSVSISIELLHISTLIIDDLIDKDEYRRGKKTFHRFIADQIQPEIEMASAIYGGNLTSYYGGKVISTSKFESCRKKVALELYLEGLAGVTRGNLLDEFYKQQVPLDQITLENYLILADKRAKQMETAVGLGALFGNARQSQLIPLQQAMNKIGIIEQMFNDLNGSFGDPELRNINSDITSGQSTILTVIGFQQASDTQKTVLSKILGNSAAVSEEINEVRDIFRDTGALDFVRMYSNSLKNDIVHSLHKVYPGLRKKTMSFYSQLLGYITEFDWN
jgi:geranylgeranyl pyrophosphate synthase